MDSQDFHNFCTFDVQVGGDECQRSPFGAQRRTKFNLLNAVRAMCRGFRGRMSPIFRHMPRRKRLNLRKDRLEVLLKPFEEPCPRMRIPWPGSIVALKLRCQTSGESCTKSSGKATHCSRRNCLYHVTGMGARRKRKYSTREQVPGWLMGVAGHRLHGGTLIFWRRVGLSGTSGSEKMLARSRSFASLRMTNLEGDEPLEKEDMQDWRRALEEHELRELVLRSGIGLAL